MIDDKKDKSLNFNNLYNKIMENSIDETIKQYSRVKEEILNGVKKNTVESVDEVRDIEVVYDDLKLNSEVTHRQVEEISSEIENKTPEMEHETYKEKAQGNNSRDTLKEEEVIDEHDKATLEIPMVHEENSPEDQTPTILPELAEEKPLEDVTQQEDEGASKEDIEEETGLPTGGQDDGGTLDGEEGGIDSGLGLTSEGEQVGSGLPSGGAERVPESVQPSGSPETDTSSPTEANEEASGDDISTNPPADTSMDTGTGTVSSNVNDTVASVEEENSVDTSTVTSGGSDSETEKVPTEEELADLIQTIPELEHAEVEPPSEDHKPTILPELSEQNPIKDDDSELEEVVEDTPTILPELSEEKPLGDDNSHLDEGLEEELKPELGGTLQEPIIPETSKPEQDAVEQPSVIPQIPLEPSSSQDPNQTEDIEETDEDVKEPPISTTPNGELGNGQASSDVVGDIQGDQEPDIEGSDTGNLGGVQADGEESVAGEIDSVQEDSETTNTDLEGEQPLIDEAEDGQVSEDLNQSSEESEEENTDVSVSEDEVGHEVEVLSEVAVAQVFSYGTDIQSLTFNDPRLATTVRTPAGRVSHFGETKGGAGFVINTQKTTVEEGRYRFQGTAKPSLVFTGGILDARATVSIVSAVDSNWNITFSGTQVLTLREYMVKAANERIDEINGYSVNPTENINDRTHLVLALSAVLEANNLNKTSHIPALALTFKDLDSLTPKQTTIDFVASTIFNTSIDCIKNIINEDSLVENLKVAKKTRGASNINLNAEGIAIDFDIKARNPKLGLNTNTRYEFIGANKDLLFYPDSTNTGTVASKLKKEGKSITNSNCISYLEGLTMTPFKTGKQIPLFETYTVKDGKTLTTISTIALGKTFTNTTAKDILCTSIDFNSIDNSTFIDYDHMVSLGASNVTMKIGGTSIKFNTLKIFDKDETISKVEIEDDRSNNYPVTLVPIDTSNLECGAYMKVTGLQRSTPYVFRKLHITAQPENESITRSFELVTLSYLSNNGTAIPHNITLRTTNFSEPKLFIELNSSRAYVNTHSVSFTSTPGSNTVPIFIPKSDVKLPNNIVMPAVKNDKTSLRYVIEVENDEVIIKDLRVNGLKDDEQYKVERIEGKDRTYFILTLFNLLEDRDYGFLILELSYIDPDNRELTTRQVLNGINVITQVNIKDRGIKQYPHYTLDNTTGPELVGADIFNVKLFNATTLEARRAEIPVFIDDINNRFLRMEFNKPESNPNVELRLEESLLKFTNLQPNSETVYKIDFIWRDNDNTEQTISKYAKISTPQVPAVDVKGTQITTTDKSAEIIFDLYETPKSTISFVVLNDEEKKFTWDTQTLTLNLTDLRPDTEYKDIEITFKLENGLITTYKIDTFKTKTEVRPPVGKVADFVKKIYTVALGREPEVEGWKFWVQKLETRELPVTQFIYDLMKQDEFIERYLSKDDFIKMMYLIVVGREPDEEGKSYWKRKYDEYQLQEVSLADLRIRIASEMMNESEFKQYVTSLGLRY